MGIALAVQNLKTSFFTRRGELTAVDDVSFDVGAGKIVGLVGESGSGKTITGFSILGLVDPPGRITGGRILFQGKNIVGLPESQLRRLRGRHIAMIFQDPMMTLNPVLRVGTQIIEAVRAHDEIGYQTARARAVEALGQLGIPDPEERLSAYPHQFSGGMRQRVAIAIAMLHRPEVIIADEPTTALDITIQSQILHHVQMLSRKFKTGLIWITHDLSVVAGLADSVCVMYAGKIVEMGSVDSVLDHPLHHYTRGLIGSVPSSNRRGEPLQQIPGATPPLFNLPAGCRFRTRCLRADDVCGSEPPILELGSEHSARCFHPHLDA